MKVVDIANEIYLENASPSDTSIPAVTFWVRSNVGKLNSMVYEAFIVDPVSLEIIDSATQEEIDEIAASIIKMMYKVYRLDLDIRGMMTGMKLDSVIEARDQDFGIKRINRSEVLKTLTTLKKDTIKEMMDLIHTYRSYHGAPAQVAGDDTEAGHYVGITDGYTRNITMGGGSAN
jgi:hypothetical protein